LLEGADEGGERVEDMLGDEMEGQQRRETVGDDDDEERKEEEVDKRR
jgi:hypothetical protein